MYILCTPLGVTVAHVHAQMLVLEDILVIMCVKLEVSLSVYLTRCFAARMSRM